MNKYQLYKPSGVEWVGDIPNNWDISRIKKFFIERNEKVNDFEFPPLSVTKNGVVPQLENVSKSDNHDDRKKVCPNDFVINSRSDRKGSSGVSKLSGSVSLINIVLEPRNIYPSYSEYLFKSYNFIEEFFKNGKGIHWDLWSTRYSELKNILIPVPSLQEQIQIVQFLDKRTELVDKLISTKEIKISLLKEQRISLINKVVTKGLNPKVKMKNIGDEWIDEIPEHWLTSRLDFLCDLKGRVGWKSLKSDEYVDNGFIFLSTPNIKNKDIDYENVNYITEERYLESPEIMLKNGDVLLVKDGSTLGIVNIVKNLPSPSTVNSSIGILKNKSNKLIPEYLFYFLTSHYCQSIINRVKGGMGVPHLFQSDIKKFKVFLPNISEQLQIIEHLKKNTKEIDDLVQLEQKKIDLLKEYRQSLISEVVTGKIKVTTYE